MYKIKHHFRHENKVKEQSIIILRGIKIYVKHNQKQERRLKRLITLGSLEIGIQHQIVNALELSTPPPPPKKKKYK